MNGVLLPFAAVAAGIVSASSPCVLPVIPGYLAAVTTSPSDRPGDFRPSVAGALGFVAGFTAVFTILGATASAIGGLLFSQLGVALKISGAVLIVLGLQTLGLIRLPALAREYRLAPAQSPHRGRGRPAALGALFAFGWTPCIGPVLATVLTKAAADASLSEGMMLLLLYSAGLGLPFVSLAIWFERSARIRRWLMRRSLTLQRLGGVAMLAAGVGYLTGAWSMLFTGVQRWLARSGWPPV